MHALKVGAKPSELLCHALVAAVKMIEPVDRALALSGECGDKLSP